jgi:hypothetical protein
MATCNLQQLHAVIVTAANTLSDLSDLITHIIHGSLTTVGDRSTALTHLAATDALLVVTRGDHLMTTGEVETREI